MDRDGLFQKYIAGTEKLPLAEVFALAGLEIVESTEGLPRLSFPRWRFVTVGV